MSNIELDRIEEQHKALKAEKEYMQDLYSRVKEETADQIDELKKGLKYDEDKAPYHLLPLDVLEPLVRIYEFGTHKYVENSWREFEPTQQNFNRIYSALMRHLAEWQKSNVKGEFAIDEESGQPTMAHVMWNAVMLMYLEQKKKSNGDNE